MFNVRIGTGSFERLTPLYDIQMPVVPRVGEIVTVRAKGEEIRYPVLAVEYCVDDQDFWGATVLVQDSGEQAASLAEAEDENLLHAPQPFSGASRKRLTASSSCSARAERSWAAWAISSIEADCSSVAAETS